MSFLSYLFPQRIARYSTKYNRDIRILEEKGKYKLLVNGSRQSGEYIRELWQHAFCEFGIIPSPDIKNILVLGIAGGTVIHLLHAIYPDAIITGVDIDERMIDIGKKYFGLDKIHGFTDIVANAKNFVQIATHKKKQWDMIIVDLFIGAEIPEFVNETSFLHKIKRMTAPKGTLVINYLRELQYLALSEELRKKLKKIFSHVEETDINFNRFFMVK